jgi:hypothetical protein
MGVGFYERSATVKATITLRTATGSTIPFDVLSLTTMFASNCFKDHAQRYRLNAVKPRPIYLVDESSQAG